MNENINLCEILKDCPKGTKLWHSVYGVVTFKYISEICNSIWINTSRGLKYTNKDGRELNGVGDCLLFPSKDQRDWNKFKAKKLKFDLKMLKAFDKVIVRNDEDTKWRIQFFSHIEIIHCKTYYRCLEGIVYYCIPYNNETKHLVGTTEEAPEYYRYWEG